MPGVGHKATLALAHAVKLGELSVTMNLYNIIRESLGQRQPRNRTHKLSYGI